MRARRCGIGAPGDPSSELKADMQGLQGGTRSRRSSSISACEGFLPRAVGSAVGKV